MKMRSFCLLPCSNPWSLIFLIVHLRYPISALSITISFSSQFKIYKLGEFNYNIYKAKLYEKASEHIDVYKTEAFKLKHLQRFSYNE
jgi:hypothetical protein